MKCLQALTLLLLSVSAIQGGQSRSVRETLQERCNALCERYHRQGPCTGTFPRCGPCLDGFAEHRGVCKQTDYPNSPPADTCDTVLCNEQCLTWSTEFGNCQVCSCVPRGCPTCSNDCENGDDVSSDGCPSCDCLLKDPPRDKRENPIPIEKLMARLEQEQAERARETSQSDLSSHNLQDTISNLEALVTDWENAVNSKSGSDSNTHQRQQQQQNVPNSRTVADSPSSSLSGVVSSDSKNNNNNNNININSNNSPANCDSCTGVEMEVRSATSGDSSSIQLAAADAGGGGNTDTYILTNNLFVAVVAGCSVAGLVGLVVAGVCWYKLQKNVKATSEVEYPAYGITGPTKERAGSPGDRKLAQSAQMYHYQHQKQQMIAMEKANGEMKHDGSEDDSEDENEEGDYTVYECPGLAPTGEMEVKNPLFNDETPVTPTPDDRGGDQK